MLDFTKALDLLSEAQKVLLTTHVKPDGDAIGSTMAMYYFLTNLKKNVRIIINESTCPDSFSFLSNTNQIRSYRPRVHRSIIEAADVIVVLDCGSLSRLTNLAAPIMASSATKILIDHHIEPELFTEFVYSNSSAIATGELIYELLKQANATITKDIAEALYTSIYTDSGGFKFNNTSATTFQIAGELVLKGASPNYIYENIYNLNSLGRLLLQGMALSSIKTYFDSQLHLMCVTREMFRKSKAKNEDTENLSQVLLSIKDSKVGIVIQEYSDNELRVSLRSKGNINVQQLAIKYGGGGHVNAAGCRLYDISTKVAKEMLVKEVESILKEK